MQRTVTKMWLESKSGRGVGGRAQRPPQSRTTIPVVTGNATCKNMSMYIYIYTQMQRDVIKM